MVYTSYICTFTTNQSNPPEEDPLELFPVNAVDDEVDGAVGGDEKVGDVIELRAVDVQNLQDVADPEMERNPKLQH